MDIDIDRRKLLGLAGGALGLAGAGLWFLDDSLAEAKTLGGSVIGTLSVPAIGVTKTIYAGTSNAVLAKGVGHGSWSVMPGVPGHSVIFGHRTSHGGPLRKVHLLKAGDQIVANGYSYTVQKTEVIHRSQKGRIFTSGIGGRSLSLIACSKANGQPTSLAYRICVRAAG